DEQHNLTAISNMNPFKLDFNPNKFVWGGLHFYLGSVMLVIGKIIGMFHLSNKIVYYFFKTDEVGNMYLFLRFIPFFSSIFCGIIIFLFLQKKIWWNFSILGYILYLIFPIVFVNSKTAKPHTLGALFVFLGFYFLCKVFDSDEIKNYIYSAIFFGLSFSVLYPNIFSIILFYLAECY
ncbi:MAG: glycosyltransferase family 39 protein, partial [Anaerolineae bacterium]|nr:glycosyltransferase family 39 protein [Anaerolineae bacterium]